MTGNLGFKESLLSLIGAIQKNQQESSFFLSVCLSDSLSVCLSFDLSLSKSKSKSDNDCSKLGEAQKGRVWWGPWSQLEGPDWGWREKINREWRIPSTWCYHRSSSHRGLLAKSKGLIDELGKTVAKVLHYLRFPLSHSLDYF